MVGAEAQTLPQHRVDSVNFSDESIKDGSRIDRIGREGRKRREFFPDTVLPVGTPGEVVTDMGECGCKGFVIRDHFPYIFVKTT